MLGYSIYKLLSATIYQLLFTQTAGTQRVFPRLYLKAALETIILALIVTWTFTLSWDPNQVWQHPAFIILGAFNFCFAWDFAPANYIALLMCSFIVYFLWRYTILVNMRLKLNRNAHLIDRIACIGNYVHAASGSVFLLIFLAGPINLYAVPMPGQPDPLPSYPYTDATYNPAIPLGNWTWHTIAFFFFIIASYFGFVLTYIESKYGSIRSQFHPLTKIYTYVLTFANLVMMIVYGLQGSAGPYGAYNPNAEACNEAVIHSLFIASSTYCSRLPGQVVIVANWFWFVVFSVAPYFIPPEAHITETYELGSQGEQGDGIQMY